MTIGAVQEDRGREGSPCRGCSMDSHVCGGRIECGVPRERKWGGDQAEHEKLNGEWLCIGGQGVLVSDHRHH